MQRIKSSEIQLKPDLLSLPRTVSSTLICFFRLEEEDDDDDHIFPPAVCPNLRVHFAPHLLSLIVNVLIVTHSLEKSSYTSRAISRA